MDRIYFDNQSTTMLSAKVIETMTEAMKMNYANPASQHEYGRIARRAMESCRERMGQRLGLGRTDRCIFTSGGTESNNLAILGHFPSSLDCQQTNIVCSAIEHPSILSVMDQLKSRGAEIRMVDADSSGVVQPCEFESCIDEKTRLVVCMMANNETGVVQPVAEIASVCSEKGIPFHIDAVQAIGKLPFHFSSLGCSSASVSAHKIHGPTGIGLLMTGKSVQLEPLVFGGFQQEGIRPGTESIPLAAGFATALDEVMENRAENCLALSQMRDRFEHRLKEQFPQLVINGHDADRLPNATNISFRGIDRQQFVLAADVAGLACSTGSACSSGSSQTSHVLASMGCEKDSIESAVRFGFSILNSLLEVDQAVERIERILSAKKP